MKDKSSGVKIKVVEGLSKLSKVLGPKLFSPDMIENFNSLLKEESW